MRNLRVLVCALVVLGTVAVASEADAARRTGLADSELIEDEDDVFFYPQLVLDYDNLITFEYGQAQNSGNGLFIAGGDSFALGVAVHRGDLFGDFDRSGGGNFADRRFPYNGPVNSALGNPTPLVTGAGEVTDLPTSSPDGAVAPHTMFDVMAGFDLGDAGQLGTRLALGIGGASQNPPDDDKTSSGQVNFLFTGGYSLEAGDLSLDTALNLAFGGADYNDLGSGDDVTSGSRFGLNLGSRVYYSLSEQADLGGLFDVGFNSLSLTNDGADDEFDATRTQFGLQLGAGPVYTIGGGETTDDPTKNMSAGWGTPPPQPDDERDTGEALEGEPTESADDTDMDDEDETRREADRRRRRPPARQPREGNQNNQDDEEDKETTWKPSATIATYGVFGVGTNGVEPNSDTDDNKQGSTSIIIPGFHAAAEVQLAKWFYFRSGAKYWFQTNTASSQVADESNRAKQGSDFSQFGWNVGVGFEHHGFRLDAALSNSFLTTGPQFISGGNTGPLFTNVSAQYAW